ncbi:MAG: hypothetical protein RL581_1110 [Actinomycetota bacterium]
MIRRKSAIGLTVASLVAAVLVVQSAPAMAAQTELTINCFNDLNMKDTLIPAYEAAHPNIKITLKTADFDAHHTGLLTQLVAGNGPDIGCFEVGYSSQFKAYPQFFTDLKKFGADKLAKNYLSWRWDQGVARNGSIIGIPTDVGGLALCYRQDLFKAAGLPSTPAEVTKATSTPAAFLALGKKYVAATGKSFIDSIGNLFDAVQRQGKDGVMYYDKKTDKIVATTNPTIKNAWNFAMAANDAKISAKIGAWSGDWNAGMGNGAFATLLCPAWMLSIIQSNAKDIPGAWNIAGMPGGGGNWGGTQLAIPAVAQHPKEAWDFINWALAPAQQLTLFKEKLVLPSTPSVYKNADFLAWRDPLFNNAPIGSIFSTVVTSIKTPIYEGRYQRAIANTFGAALGRVEDGKQSSTAAWAQAVKEIKRLG